MVKNELFGEGSYHCSAFYCQGICFECVLPLCFLQLLQIRVWEIPCPLTPCKTFSLIHDQFSLLLLVPISFCRTSGQSLICSLHYPMEPLKTAAKFPLTPALF